MRPDLSGQTLAEFYATCERTAEGCLQPPSRQRGPYVQITRGRRQMYAHRWAWTLAHGPIPLGMVLLHTCDNPRCSNVEHLALGTYAENSADMMTKGRTRGHSIPLD